jgi:hypothetical protein
MPVIRSKPGGQSLPENTKEALLKRLVAELEGNESSDGPVIFEMPIFQSDKIDVMVIWQDWKDVRSEDRVTLIKEAYKDKADGLSLTLGLTLEEAIQEGALPYRVRLRFQEQPKFPEGVMENALLSVGAFLGTDGEVIMRFPTPETAEAARQRLSEKLPGSVWVVSHADN